MRQRFAPSPAPGDASAAAAALMTPRPATSSVQQQQHSLLLQSSARAPPAQAGSDAVSALPAAVEAQTPVFSLTMGASSFKENLAQNLAQSFNGSLGGSAIPAFKPTQPQHSTFSAPAGFTGTPATLSKAMGGAAAAEPDSLLQQASSMFLQQVEDMRRKYTQEVEQLKVRIDAWRLFLC